MGFFCKRELPITDKSTDGKLKFVWEGMIPPIQMKGTMEKYYDVVGV